MRIVFDLFGILFKVLKCNVKMNIYAVAEGNRKYIISDLCIFWILKHSQNFYLRFNNFTKLLTDKIIVDTQTHLILTDHHFSKN